MSATVERRHLALRVPTQALTQIDQQAEAHGLTRTEYVIKACTGQLQASDTQERLEAVEHAVRQLQELAYR